MADPKDPSAVAVAKAHAEAWSSHDWKKARRMLAEDVRVDATSTQSIVPPTHTTGAEEYMEGLVRFAQAIKPGSLKVLGTAGDDRNSALLVTVRASLGPGAPEVTIASARILLLAEDGKIQAEQVVFFAFP